jgi:hypothetical protein
MTYALPDKTVVYGPGDFFFESGDINHTVFNDGPCSFRNLTRVPQWTLAHSGEAPLIKGLPPHGRATAWQTHMRATSEGAHWPGCAALQLNAVAFAATQDRSRLRVKSCPEGSENPTSAFLP